jgi:intracellular septation protein A
MKGTFRAFLSGRDQNLDSLVRAKDARLPVVNIKGEILFNSWKDIFSGSSGSFAVPPRIYSFDGRSVLTDSTWYDVSFVWIFFLLFCSL